MFPTLFNPTAKLLEQSVQFSEARHNVLAGNIANMDTPGYRAADLSPVEFQSRLKEALETEREQEANPSTASSLGSSGETTEDAFSPVRESAHNLVYHDDSNIDLEHEVAELTKNQMQFNLAVSLLSSQFRTLQAAISERA